MYGVARLQHVQITMTGSPQTAARVGSGGLGNTEVASLRPQGAYEAPSGGRGVISRAYALLL